MKESIKEISLKLKEVMDPNDVFLAQCKEDERKGVVEFSQ